MFWNLLKWLRSVRLGPSLKKYLARESHGNLVCWFRQTAMYRQTAMFLQTAMYLQTAMFRQTAMSLCPLVVRGL